MHRAAALDEASQAAELYQVGFAETLCGMCDQP
jgi:hypothetical protein